MEGNMPQGEMGGAQNQGQQNSAGQESNQGQSQTSSGVPSGGSDMKAEAKGLVGQLEALLDEYMVKKAPFTLPLGLKEFIVKVAPYLIIIMAVFAVPAILLALGLSTVFTPVAMMGGYGGWGFSAIVTLIATAITLVMEVMAVPGLFKRTQKGWRLVFYATIVSLIGSILSVSGIIGGIIGAIIGWYILFQVKELYKN
ncbi:MAG: hypothetical protein Q8Q10_04640 [bacterium]|nr:hypothetical protein [bacterium]